MPNFLINVSTTGVKSATRGMKKLTGSLKSLSKVAMVGAAGGAVALGVAMKKATSAAAEQELQERKLAQALGTNTDALLKQAGALQQTSRFGDEAIIQQQAYMASIGMSEQQIKDYMPVILDLASATGMSLESAVKNTSKTLSGMTGELGESVPALKELTAAELKAGKGVEVMRKMFKGAAENETKTFTGAMDQAKNAMGDAAESLGNLLLPMATDGAKVLKKFSEDAIEAFDFIGEIDFSKTFENMKNNLGALTTLIAESFKLAFKAIPDLFGFYVNRIVPIMTNVLGMVWKGIKGISAFLWEPIGIGIQIVIAKVKNFFIGMINFVKEQFNSLTAIANSFGANFETFEMTKLIDTEGLSMANAQVVQLLKEGSEDNLNTFSDFQAAQLELYKNYSDQVIALNEEQEDSDKKKTDNKIKGQKAEGEATKKTTKVTLESGIQAGMSAQSSLEAVRNVIKAKFSEMIAGFLAKEIGSKGLLGIVTGAAGAASAMALFDKLVPKFASGGEFVTSGKQLMMVGDNPSGRERVEVTPLGADPTPNASGSGLTINISGNVLSQDFVEGELAENIRTAIRRGTDFGIG